MFLATPFFLLQEPRNFFFEADGMPRRGLQGVRIRSEAERSRTTQADATDTVLLTYFLPFPELILE